MNYLLRSQGDDEYNLFTNEAKDYFVAGCRRFTKAEALGHWGNDLGDSSARAELFVKAIHELNNIKTESSMGDVADRAGEEGEVLAQAKEEQRRRDMEVMNTPSGVTECEECEVDITARVAKVPAAKLC